MKQLKLALIGFGNAGRAFTSMLMSKQTDIRTLYDCEILVTAIVTATRGTLVCDEGIDLAAACADIENNGHFDKNSTGFCQKNAMEVIAEADYDVMCELTPLNIKTGQPATGHILAAIARKKHVITANKGPVAWHYDEILRAAEEANVKFFYETTVMDGTPVFNLAEKTLKLCQITEIKGILNSTTNYILDEMAKEVPYEEIIARGRKRGFIEADMAMDTNGYDAAAKLTVLMNIFMNANMTPDNVCRKGIDEVTAQNVFEAAAQNKKIKLICRGRKTADGFEAAVRPEMVDNSDLYASVDGTTSVVTLTTDLMGTISVVEHEPEIEQTAYGIFSDMLRILDEK